MDYNFKDGLDFAKELDEKDDLKEYRNHFYLKEDEIYMDGNSLGLASKEGEKSLLKILDIWKEEAIKIWNIEDGKYHQYSRHLAKKMAPLVGAKDNEVVITGSTTSNIHQAISTFYKPTKEKYKILVDDLNFASDRYAVDSQIRIHGLEVEDAVKVVKSEDGKYIDEDKIIEAMTEDVSLILLPTILYRSSQILDMKRLTEEAHKRNIIIGFDLCHAIGAIEIDFSDIKPDFAVWCTYKYLSGGPGSIAGLYINEKHFKKLPGMAGWYGNKLETQFQLKHEFDHEEDASGWQIGTPSLFSMAPLDGVLDIFKEVGMKRIREKSLKLTAYFMYLVDNKLGKYGYKIDNPRDNEKRGGHICLTHNKAYQISIALRDLGVIPDFREPNVIRIAPIALYNTFEELYRVVEILEKIALEKTYENYSEIRKTVI
ncbi:MAG: kynureninase [Miniphocaeibacter sp.]|uniref:kynureninase n=1 Tax=Miniphocaeibacter sp. TaxID=3100973 RepID=UPI0017E790A6|nr:kynureninase [Gallicola sp.]